MLATYLGQVQPDADFIPAASRALYTVPRPMSALCPQISHVAITSCTPFLRMFGTVMGGPCFSRATIPNARPLDG